MKTRAALLTASLALLPFLAAGCGGADDNNSGSRPSAEEISDAFADQIPGDPETTKPILDCLGTELEKSKLPNGVLRSLVAGEEEAEIDAKNEEKYNGIVTDVISTCSTQALGG